MLLATWMRAAGRLLALASALNNNRRSRGKVCSVRAEMCSPDTSNGDVGPNRMGRDARPSRPATALGSASSRRSVLITAADGFTTPASYLVKARGPPPTSSPASSCERPRYSRMARISSGAISGLLFLITVPHWCIEYYINHHGHIY